MKYLQVSFEIYSGDSDHIKERIDRGLPDIGLLLEPVDIGKCDFVRTNIKEEWSAWASEHSHLAEKDFLMPQDFAGISLIFPRRELAKGRIYKWLGEYADENSIAATGNLLYNMTVIA